MDFEHRLDAYRYKRKSYQHEQELRALFIDYPPQKGADRQENPEGYEDMSSDFDPFKYLTREERIPNQRFNPGQFEDVDISSLIEEVRINPWNDEDFVHLVRSIVEKYELSAEVKQSDMSGEPLY